MNKGRKKALNDIAKRLIKLRGTLEELQSEEEEYCDNNPKDPKTSEIGYAINYVKDAISDLGFAVDNILYAAYFETDSAAEQEDT